MIDLSQPLLMSLLLSSFIGGVLLGVVYEVMHFFKLLFSTEKNSSERKQAMLIFNRAIIYALTFLTDVLFCLFFAVCAITLTYKMSGGVFRGMVYTAMLSGLFIYHLTLGRLFLKLNKKVVRLVRKAIGELIALIKIPLKAFFSLFVKIYHLTMGRLIGKIRGKINEIRKMRENKRKAAEKQISEIVEEKEGLMSCPKKILSEQ